MRPINHLVGLAIFYLAVQGAPSSPESSLLSVVKARQGTLDPVAPNETNLFKDVVPQVVTGGTVTDAQVKELIDSLPAPGAIIAEVPSTPAARRGLRLGLRQNPIVPITVDETSLAQPTTNFFFNATTAIPEVQVFDIIGPFRSIEVVVGGRVIKGIEVTDDEGKAYSTGQSIGTRSKFTFEDGEFITEFNILQDPADVHPDAGPLQAGISFKTNIGRDFNAVGSTVASDPARFKTTTVAIGSGVIGRLRGSSSSPDPNSNFLTALNIDFIDTFTSVEIVDIVYDDFNANLFPAGEGVTMSVGSQALDNRAGSITQKMILKLTKAVAKQSTFALDIKTTVGTSVAIAVTAKVPFIATSTVTGTASWDLSVGTTITQQDTTTFTQDQTFELSCPATKFCRGQGTLVEYKLDVGFTAVFAAKTKQGKQFRWTKRGNYKGSQAVDAKLTIEEYDSATTPPPAVPR